MSPTTSTIASPFKVKPTTIEIYTVTSASKCEIGLSPADRADSLFNGQSSLSEGLVKGYPKCADISDCPTLCIKIIDPHGNLINLPPHGSQMILSQSPVLDLRPQNTQAHHHHNYHHDLARQKQLFEKELSLQIKNATAETKTTDHEKPNKKTFLKLLVNNIPAIGILCALISVLCFSFNSVIVKLLKTNYGITGNQVLVTRSIFQFVICGLTVLIKRDSFLGQPGSRLILFCRALTGTISLCCVFTAFNLMPIGDATTIYFSSPVIVTVFAYFLLGEPFCLVQFATCLLTIFGVGFISKPEFIFGRKADIHYPYHLLGQILAIVAAVTSSITIINLRKLKTTPAHVVVFWFAASILLFGSVAIYFLGTFKPIDPSDMLCMGLLSTIGVMSILEQYFLTVALQHENATTISVTRSFNIVLSFVWEVVIFSETITWTSLVGAVLVSGCILILAMSKSWESIRQTFATTFRLDSARSIDLEQPKANAAGCVATDTKYCSDQPNCNMATTTDQYVRRNSAYQS